MDQWRERERTLDFRSAVILGALGAKKHQIEETFPSLRREYSVRENMERLEAAVAGRTRHQGDKRAR